MIIKYTNLLAALHYCLVMQNNPIYHFYETVLHKANEVPFYLGERFIFPPEKSI